MYLYGGQEQRTIISQGEVILWYLCVFAHLCICVYSYGGQEQQPIISQGEAILLYLCVSAHLYLCICVFVYLCVFVWWPAAAADHQLG